MISMFVNVRNEIEKKLLLNTFCKLWISSVSSIQLQADKVIKRITSKGSSLFTQIKPDLISKMKISENLAKVAKIGKNRCTLEEHVHTNKQAVQGHTLVFLRLTEKKSQ